MRNDQLIRQWRMLILLDGSSGRTQQSLAEELGCSTRTIQRDLEALTIAGFPITYGVRGHEFYWFIHAGFRVPGIPFTLSELLALSLARNFYSLLPIESLAAAYRSAIAKIEKVFPAVKDLELFSSGGTGRKDYSGQWSNIQILVNAVRTRNRISMTYFAYGKKELSARIVDPYDLWHAQETLYLIGYCHLRQDLRLFAVERIQHVEQLPERFEVRTGYSLNAFRQNRFRVMQEDATMTVRIRFSSEVSDYVQDRLWHPSQRFEKQADSRLVLTMETAGSTEILNWVLGYGPEAEILEPYVLRKRAITLAKRMLQQYQSVPKLRVKRAGSTRSNLGDGSAARKHAPRS
ncbi:transcriptional regulator [bacterium]|nr:transcriptional regulator [bacterium]MCI0604150.1 transcriptional regulator [bacterium]